MPPGREELGLSPERTSTIRHTEKLLAMFNNGEMVMAAELFTPGLPEEAFATLNGIYDTIRAGLDDVPPEELLEVLREVKALGNKLDKPARTLHLARAIVEHASIEFPLDLPVRNDYEYLPPEELSSDEQMSASYYDTVNTLFEASKRIRLSHEGSLIEPEITRFAKTHTTLGNSLYGRYIQHALLEQIARNDPSGEVLFRAYMTAPNKARVPPLKELEEYHEEVVDTLKNITSYANDHKGRLGNYIRATHDVLGAATILRQQYPTCTSQEVVQFLYANTTAIGESTRRSASANPLYHVRDGMNEDHLPQRFLQRIAAHPYQLLLEEDSIPRLHIPEGQYAIGEYPDTIFSKDPLKRKLQEEQISRQRMNSGRCPIRYPLHLPEGWIKDSIRAFDASIKEQYAVDPQIFLNDRLINPAALAIARVIQAGVTVGTETNNLWTTGLQEYGVPSPA